MFTEYVAKAMRKATYELLGDGSFYGEIPGFQGVLANAPTLEECREELQGALEAWLVVGLWMNDESLPRLGRLDVVPRKFVESGKNESTQSPRSRKAS
jgi:predicted RNase H-like HicB family nuclease